MALDALYEVSNYFININKNEESISTWHNSMLTIRSEKGLHFYELAHNIDCLDKKINCLQTFLPAIKSKATSKLFTENVINNSMRNIDYVEMTQDQTLWPHNPQLVEEMTSIVSFEWSPVGLLPNQGSVLAIMNNIGGVDLIINEYSKWKHKLEITASFSETLRKSLKEPRQFAEMKEAAHILASTAICWAPTLAGTKSCYIATAQKNDIIMFWLVVYNNTNITAQFQGSIESGEGEILAMKWIQLSETHFILICSNIFGQIILFDCMIQNSQIHISDSQIIWSDKDRMISMHLQYIILNDKIIIICNKHRHLLILMIDEHYNVCGQYVKNINDYRITCITKTKDKIYLSTVNSEIFKVDITIKDDLSLNVNLHKIECKDISPTTELYDISFSQNDVLCAMVTLDRKVNYRKQSMKINVIFATTKEKLDSLINVLLENPTNKLTNYWDVVELLRYKCMKHKEVPSIDYNKLYEEACHNIYLLKLYLVFIRFYTNLKNLSKINPIDSIPEESLETIKEEILVIHAELLFRQYNEKRLSEGQLHGIEYEGFLGALKFLEYYCQKNNRVLSDILTFEKSDLGENLCGYTCQGCDEPIQGFTCRNKHLNMFCSLTFTPIESFEYMACVWCNRTARIELASEEPQCVICDVYLVKV